LVSIIAKHSTCSSAMPFSLIMNLLAGGQSSCRERLRLMSPGSSWV
jgi:hypothetical protein